MKKLENRIIQQEKLIKVYSANVIATMTDKKGFITYASDAFIKISGYSRDELLGKPHNIVRHIDVSKDVFADLWKTIKSGKTWVNEVKNRKKDGSSYWVIATVSPDYDENENIIGYTSVRQDITEKKKNERLHDELKTLFENLPTGFLTIDKDLKIKPNYSNECKRVLACEKLENLYFPDLVFGNDEVKKELFEYGFANILNASNDFSKELLISLLPKEHNLGDIWLALKYNNLKNGNTLVVLYDITSKKKMESKIKYEQQMQKMIIAIATHQHEAINLKNSFLLFLDNMDLIVDQHKDCNDIFIYLKRELHTFKGLFAQKEMVYLTNEIHEIESVFQNFYNSDFLNLKSLCFNMKRSLKEALKKDIEVIDNVLGKGYLENEEFVKVELSYFDKLSGELNYMIDQASSFNKEQLIQIQNKVNSFLQKPISYYFHSYPNLVKNLAADLGKEIEPLQIICNDYISVDKTYKPFFDSLVHVFRNSIDHGIETPEQRDQKSKPIIGKIVCEIELEKKNIIIKISDDGNGLDIDKILKKALDKNILTKKDLKNTEQNQIAKLIFEEEFTTNENSNTLSGRGIGLSAVKYEIDRLNGNIQIINNFEKGLKFIFSVPYPNIENFMELRSISLERVILDEVEIVAKNLLENDFELEVQKVEILEQWKIFDLFAIVSISKQRDIYYLLSFENGVGLRLLDFFLENDEAQEEKAKFLYSLIGEVLNTVAGLLMTGFKCDEADFYLSEILAFDISIIESLRKNNSYCSHKITTDYGDIVGTIIKINKQEKK